MDDHPEKLLGRFPQYFRSTDPKAAMLNVEAV